MRRRLAAAACAAAIALLGSQSAGALPSEDGYRKAVESALSISAFRTGETGATARAASMPDHSVLVLAAEGLLLTAFVARDRSQSRREAGARTSREA